MDLEYAMDDTPVEDTTMPMDLQAVHTVVAVVPMARVNIPKLSHVEAVFDWIEDVKRYVILAEADTDATIVADKLILSIDPKGEPSMQDFKTLLSAYRLPGTVEDSAKARMKDLVTHEWRDRTLPELQALVHKAVLGGKTRVGKAVGPTYVVVERQEMVWEWLQAFLEVVYLDEARINHYKDLLEEHTIVLPPLSEGLPASNTALNRHVVKVKMLMKFSKTSSLSSQKRALVRTFRLDQTLYREASRGNSWEEVLQAVRRELDSRVSAHTMGHLQLNRSQEKQTVSVVGASLGDDMNSVIQAHINALSELGVKYPNHKADSGKKSFKMNNKKFSENRGREHKPYGRGSSSRADKDRAKGQTGTRGTEGTCHWCGLKGHIVRVCQAKRSGVPTVFPPKPADVSWEAHKVAHPLK